jgi:hypothetical protein
MAFELVFEALGQGFRIASTSAALGAALGPLLRGFPEAAERPSPEHCLLIVENCARHAAPLCAHRRGGRSHTASSAAELLAWLLPALNTAALDGYAGLAVHAGVLGRGERAIALPARSGAGKTTLVAAGLRAGFGYLSDEALCVDFGSRAVAAYPRPLVMSGWSREAVGAGRSGTAVGTGEWALTPQDLGGDVLTTPAVLADIVLPVRRPGPPALARADRSEALGWLLRRSFNHYRRPGPAFSLAADLVRRAGAWRLEVGDPLEAAALLVERLGHE